MLSSAARTHRGNIRKINEDAILNHPDYQLYAIADGMGGHSVGDLASQAVISELTGLKLDTYQAQEAVNCIETSLNDVNKKINSGLNTDNSFGHISGSSSSGKVRESNRIIGSTVVVVYIKNNLCSCFWVGDSRLYIYRNKKLYQITRDHSLVQEMVDDGQLTHEEALNHPKANIITRALGVCQELEIDLNQFEIQAGDKLLLCSDGLYKELNSKNIIAALEAHNVEAIANNLLGEVLIGDATDNVSFIVIDKQ
ncbi:MAG: protein phosphatase 2C domain-containing protein [Gammaproteobacteria bacterium]|nr:protein phosphatase 2C domain-containing protein [Gammaproteobacteria bacterium]